VNKLFHIKYSSWANFPGVFFIKFDLLEVRQIRVITQHLSQNNLGAVASPRDLAQSKRFLRQKDFETLWIHGFWMLFDVFLGMKPHTKIDIFTCKLQTGNHLMSFAEGCTTKFPFYH